MLKIVSTGSHQCNLQRFRPFLVGLGKPPHLVGSQAEVTKHSAERLATVDRVEELLRKLNRQPLLRSRSPADPLVDGVRLTA
jgi:hypothetical protein